MLSLALGGVVLVIVALVAVLGFVKPGFFTKKTLDAGAVQQGVSRVLHDNYTLNATAVSCPGGVAVTPGATFTCTATINGTQQRVPILIKDSTGLYEVGRPS